MQSAQVQTPPLDLVPIASVDGVPVWIPRITYDLFMSRGGGKIVAEIAGNAIETITVTDAAKEHCKDVDDLKFDAAKMRVLRAVERGQIKAVGHGRSRRIEKTDFKAWRLAERERELNRHDNH